MDDCFFGWAPCRPAGRLVAWFAETKRISWSSLLPGHFLQQRGGDGIDDLPRPHLGSLAEPHTSDYMWHSHREAAAVVLVVPVIVVFARSLLLLLLLLPRPRRRGRGSCSYAAPAVVDAAAAAAAATHASIGSTRFPI